MGKINWGTFCRVSVWTVLHPHRRGWRSPLGCHQCNRIPIIEKRSGDDFGIESLAVDPNNADTLHILTGKYTYSTPHLYKSTDAGNNWIGTVSLIAFRALHVLVSRIGASLFCLSS